jgi:hypothetical protein
LGERGFDAIAEVNIHTRTGISFWFHRDKTATEREHETGERRKGEQGGALTQKTNFTESLAREKRRADWKNNLQICGAGRT